MAIHPLDGTAAVAKTNAFLLGCEVADAAVRMAHWQFQKNATMIPMVIDPPPLDEQDDDSDPDIDAFRRRANAIRDAISDALIRRTHGNIKRSAIRRIPFLLRKNPETDKQQVWFLMPNSGATLAAMTAHARKHPGIYLELVLLQELSQAKEDQIADASILAEFGSSVYLWGSGPFDEGVIQLAAIRFDANPKYNRIICNLQMQAFARDSPPSDQDQMSMTVDVGRGQMLDIVKFYSRSKTFKQVDARKRPLPGISLKHLGMRRTRLYYLLVISEFTDAILREAGIPFAQEEFQATHVITDAFIPAKAIAQLVTPLAVVSASGVPLTEREKRAFSDMGTYLGPDFWESSASRCLFQQPNVTFLDNVPVELHNDRNYLFINGKPQFKRGTASIPTKDGQKRYYLQPQRAYALLEAGTTDADAYTVLKFRHLMDTDGFSCSMQGLNIEPADLGLIQRYQVEESGSRKRDPSKKAEGVREKAKRVLLELSIKECLGQHKSIPAPAIPADLQPAALTVLATRHIRVRRNQYKQLISSVLVSCEKGEIRVVSTAKSRWSTDYECALRFLLKYPFLQPDEKHIRDRQFWIVDNQTGDRLRVWSGSFVPKILFNAIYPSIEDLLALQEEELRESHPGGFGYYSKSHKWNFLPYYMHAFDDGVLHEKFQEREAIYAQDRGEFLRLFIPSAEAISGRRANLSCFRDIMVYRLDGSLVQAGLLEHKLVRIYLHTMTAGMLVAANNSKMSLLEKLARLQLEN